MGATRGLLLGVALVVQGAGCERRSEAPVEAAASARPVRLPEDGDADEAVRVLAGLYQPAVSVHSAVERARECMQKTAGYEALVACLDKASQHASSIARQVPSVHAAAGTCGPAVEKAERELLAAAPPYLAQLAQAVRSKQDKLAGALKGKTLGAYCAQKSAAAVCDALPKDPSAADSPARAADLANVLGVACVPQLFQCGEAADPCGVQDVIERLGLAVDATKNKVDGAPASALRVRASQRVIQPLKR